MDVVSVKRIRELYSGRGYELTTAGGLPVFTSDGLLYDERENVVRRKIGVSLCSGCRIGCVYCFTNRLKKFCPLTAEEIVAQVDLAINDSSWLTRDYDELKISFKQMGDPLVNPEGTLTAIQRLAQRLPAAQFVVSTSGARLNGDFFRQLAKLGTDGISIRLQFSCHTTSNDERRRLSPKLDMLTFEELSELVRAWPHDRATLNFVVMDGFSYDATVIGRVFDRDRVFVKVGHIDRNHCTAQAGLVTAANDKVREFETGLESVGFTFARRFSPISYLHG
ncbi:MAG: radical SAM protein [Patescibacteria group bacterium]